MAVEEARVRVYRSTAVGCRNGDKVVQVSVRAGAWVVANPAARGCVASVLWPQVRASRSDERAESLWPACARNQEESKELSGDQVEQLWILEIDGKKRLPAFSSQKKIEAFSGKMSTNLNKVFSLGCVEVLLSDMMKSADIDFVDLDGSFPQMTPSN